MVRYRARVEYDGTDFAGFMDGIETYRQFPRELRDRIEGKNIVIENKTGAGGASLTLQAGADPARLVKLDRQPQIWLQPDDVMDADYEVK